MKSDGPIRNRGVRYEELDLSIQAALTALRKHLNMEIGFVSEFFDGWRTIRFVDAEADQVAVNPGDSLLLRDGYCQMIVNGALPELIPDMSAELGAMSIGFTSSLPVGSHVGVPIRLPSGQLYGTLCCFRRTPEPSLGIRDLNVVRVIADIIGSQLARSASMSATFDADYSSIRAALKGNQPTVVFQSIVDLDSLSPIGFECLSRFESLPKRPPNLWFDLAETFGMGVELETNAIRNGIQEYCRFPNPLFLSLNCSPSMIQSGRLNRVLDGLPLSKIVVEVTEQMHVDCFSSLRRVLAPLRAKGLRTAMDDTGAGYANLEHLIELGPDFIKLDGMFAKAVGQNASSRAMVAAIVAFANETGSTVIAEQIEDSTALRTLRGLGVHCGQGFHFSRPSPIEEAVLLSG